MTRKERFHATIERRPVDRPASWLGMPVPEAVPGIYDYFGVKNETELKFAINDDLWCVEFPYHSPTSDFITQAFDFVGQGKADPNDRSLNKPGFFRDITDASEVESFSWPDPEKYINPEECRKAVESVPEDYAVMATFWSCHFQDACAAFGMEDALMNMIEEPEIFEAVIQRIVHFYLKANRIFLEATQGKLDAVLIGNDFGSQLELMVSKELLRKYVFSGTKQLIDQIHSYGVKVIHHSCGAIHGIIPDLMGLGADALHPIQALARNMDIDTLHRDFFGKASFVGGVDAQELLVKGTPAQIREKVRRIRELFPTGLVISPSHEAIMQDVPPANIEALFLACQHE